MCRLGHLILDRGKGLLMCWCLARELISHASKSHPDPQAWIGMACDTSSAPAYPWSVYNVTKYETMSSLDINMQKPQIRTRLL
ncbi:uncharacterized protein LY89DRAFT_376643 [Mollisia scopiformis]|uniref:Uncharacterized protein n=1 Tax=Mollisia scopiformis TaxID=149040 RepID=A0A194XMN5_MOLSC|nr:uncharacterized protein LY89DRAFT_376643 [Mollisia scopiformis]KUJ21520.1 hypothetical protein LY89DRAFT_376643 [Mollisia scopiformis]